MEFHFDLENPLPTSHDLYSDTLTTLFNNESHHMPSNTLLDRYICTRGDIISRILQFSRNFDPFLSYLAINYLDRFLSVNSLQQTKPWIFKLVTVSCISLAFKMSETESSVSDIQHDGGSVFDSRTIERMEYLILSSLKWRMRSITPFSFIKFFISLFNVEDQPLRQALKARATEIIFQAHNEIKLLEFKPSIISASALLSALHELYPPQFPCYKKAIFNCPYVHEDKLLSCYNMMQDLVMDGYRSTFNMVSSTRTPINVLDLHCMSKSDSDDKKQQSQTCIGESDTDANAIDGFERDQKRRKISSSGCRNDNTFQLSQIQQC